MRIVCQRASREEELPVCAAKQNCRDCHWRLTLMVNRRGMFFQFLWQTWGGAPARGWLAAIYQTEPNAGNRALLERLWVFALYFRFC